MKMMISKLLSGNEGINAATVLALSGTIAVVVAKGEDPVSLKRVVSEVLSNPVPRLMPTTKGGTPVRGAVVPSLRTTTPAPPHMRKTAAA